MLRLLSIALVSVFVIANAAYAADEMKKDGMMKKDTVTHKGDAMKKDAMAKKDGMMKKDGMTKTGDTMKKDAMMKKDSMIKK